MALFRYIVKTQNLTSGFCKLRNLTTLASLPHAPKPFLNPYLGRPVFSPQSFGQHSWLPNENHPNIGVVTYPTSLFGGCFDQYIGETALVPVQGMNYPLLPLRITPEKREVDLHSAIQRNGSSDVKDLTDSEEFGMFRHLPEELREEGLLVAPPYLHKEVAMSEEGRTAAMSSLIDAILDYNYSAMGIRCATKKIKFAKWRKGRMGGISHRGNVISFGNYALQVLDNAWITAKQLEAGRRALSRIVGRGAKIWVRAITDKPVTERPAETRMGRGKGAVSYFVAVVQPGRILYEISGVTESIARKAVDVAASKLPVRTRFIITA